VPPRIWFPLDTGFLGGDKVSELGARFGAGGPLAYIAMLAAAKSNDEEGSFLMSFKALSRKAFLPSAKRAEMVVSAAEDLRLLEVSSVDAFGFVGRICDWDQWQVGSRSNGAKRTKAWRSRRHRDSTVTGTDTETDTEEAKASSSPVAEVKLLPHAAEAISLCETLADLIAKNGSMRPKVNEAWLSSARRLLHRDERPYEEALSLIRWCQADEFWRGNVLSMPTFRKQYDRLRLAAQRNDGRHLKAVDSGRSYERKDLSGYDKFDGEDSA
jgi:hypothetical protein